MWRCSNAMLLCQPPLYPVSMVHPFLTCRLIETCGQSLRKINVKTSPTFKKLPWEKNEATTKKTAKTTWISWTWGTRWFKLYFIPGSLKVTIPTFWFWVAFSPSLKEVTELQGNQTFPRFVLTFDLGKATFNHGSVGWTIISIYEFMPLRVFHGDWKGLYIFIEQKNTYMHALFFATRAFSIALIPSQKFT